MAITRRDFLIGSGAVVATSAIGFSGGGAGGCAGERLPDESYDLCIIGSGFAGTFLGLRALDHGLRTVIVEAGSGHQGGGSSDSLEA